MSNNFNDIGSNDLMQPEESCIRCVRTVRTYIRTDAYVQWNISHFADNKIMLSASDQ